MANIIPSINKSESTTKSLPTVPYSPQGLLKSLPSPLNKSTGWCWTEETKPLPPTMKNGKPWPKISIVTPSYNQGEFIEETIRSVLLQNYPNLEYIIMDGGSTDETQAILERYSPWLSYVVSEPDGGQSDAIATGFEIASGKIIAWLCSDDLYLEGALEWVVNQYQINPNIDIICGIADLNQGTGQICEHPYRDETPTYPKLISRGQCVRQPASFWTKEIYQKTAGIDRSLQFCMDYDLLIKLCRVGKAKYIRKDIAWIRLHQNCKSLTLQHIHAQEKAKIVEQELKKISIPNVYLCTLSYWCLLNYYYRTPTIQPLKKIWKIIRLLISYVYRFLNGDVFTWHPINRFCKTSN